MCLDLHVSAVVDDATTNPNSLFFCTRDTAPETDSWLSGLESIAQFAKAAES